MAQGVKASMQLAIDYKMCGGMVWVQPLYLPNTYLN